jgi:UDP-MurNAc hydroxylase
VKITFINHASFLLESGGTSIWSDPWTKGKVCNGCAALYSPSPEICYERVEHIWLSHEHSDHFNFATLKSIPPEERRRIVVLYQRHSSPRVKEAFQKLGFEKFHELPLYRWVQLKPGMDILCGSVGTMDSFLAMRSEGECVLNMNDCVCTNAQISYIKRLVGSVSVLFTQFSFANWIGNYADESDAIGQKLREFQYRVLALRPEFTVPFASFCYFCSEENSWMNQFVITPRRVAALGLPGVNFMYPGDEWDSRVRAFRSEEAVTKFEKDMQVLKIDPIPESVDQEKVQEAVVKIMSALRRRFGRWVLRRIEPFEIYAHDTNKIFRISPVEVRCDVREATPESAGRARYVMCSQVAWYSFAFTWGWNVLEGAGPYLDREFKTKGSNELLSRCITELSTDILRFDSAERILRTVRFLWAKKFEMLYKALGKPIDENMVRELANRESTRRNSPTASAAAVVRR